MCNAKQQKPEALTKRTVPELIQRAQHAILGVLNGDAVEVGREDTRHVFRHAPFVQIP